MNSTILAAILLASGASNEAAVGIPLPPGALEPAPEAVVAAPAPAADDADLTGYVPAPEPRQVLVGRAAWYDQKFSDDPFTMSDHGRPEVVFDAGGQFAP